MLAVLVDAINVLMDRGPRAGGSKRQPFGEAAVWVITRGNRYLFSFDSVCDALNIAPEWLRERLGGVALKHGLIGCERPRHLRIHASSRIRKMTANQVREKPLPARDGESQQAQPDTGSARSRRS